VAVVYLLAAVHYSFGIYVGHEASFDPVNILLNMLMIRSDINVPMWSLTVECFAAPIIFLGVFLFRRRGVLPLWISVAVLFGLSFWGPYVHMLGGATSLAPLYAFIVGIIVHFEGGRLTGNLSSRAATYGALLSLLIFFICGFKKQTAPILALECLSASSIVALVAYSNTSISKPLDFRLVRFYGQISYSFYLLHMLGILMSFRLIEPLKLSGGSVFGARVLTTLVAVLCTTPAAYLFWKFIEIPAIQIGRAIKPPQFMVDRR
jgi:peptidoglycan/LPS O-acetylase OafA/YrhL